MPGPVICHNNVFSSGVCAFVTKAVSMVNKEKKYLKVYILVIINK